MAVTDSLKMIQPSLEISIDETSILDLHYHWSHMYMEHWSRKWHYKYRRGREENPLERY